MRSSSLAPALLLLPLAAACPSEKPAPPPAAQAEPAPAPKPVVTVDRERLAAFAPLPNQLASPKNPLTEEKVQLGRRLFFEARLSKSGTISCNSCHNLATYGVDREKTSPGHDGKRGKRNSPTVLNAAGHVAQFWDGRAPDVEEQAKGPVVNPIEMGLKDGAAVVAILKKDKTYVEQFKKAFPEAKDPVTFDNFGRAIGAYERMLVTPGRWDKFLAGDDAALTAEEKQGLNAFLETGCIACHTGPYLGGHLYQKAGVMVPWPNQEDQGRFEVTKQDMDKMMFKVPTLRNVAETAPYFHDGSAATLEDAVRVMAKHQLNKALAEDDVRAMVAWLKALTGDVPPLASPPPAAVAEAAK